MYRQINPISAANGILETRGRLWYNVRKGQRKMYAYTDVGFAQTDVYAYIWRAKRSRKICDFSSLCPNAQRFRDSALNVKYYDTTNPVFRRLL